MSTHRDKKEFTDFLDRSLWAPERIKDEAKIELTVKNKSGTSKKFILSLTVILILGSIYTFVINPNIFTFISVGILYFLYLGFWLVVIIEHKENATPYEDKSFQ